MTLRRYDAPVLVDLVKIRSGGLRLRPSELQEPIRGDLVLLDDTGTHSSFKRPIRVAHLYQSTTGWQDGRQDATKPLFDAQVIRVEGDTIILTGLELESTAGGERVFEHGQVWRCTVVAAADATASRPA